MYALAFGAVGAIGGFCYASSLTYSLELPGGRGMRTGIHEATVGSGIVLGSLLGGLVTRLGPDGGGESLRALKLPYLLAPLVVLSCVALQLVLYRLRRAPAQQSREE